MIEPPGKSAGLGSTPVATTRITRKFRQIHRRLCSGAGRHLEMGAIAERICAKQLENPPAILFENFPAAA
jgi:hypothetical protein